MYNWAASAPSRLFYWPYIYNFRQPTFIPLPPGDRKMSTYKCYYTFNQAHFKIFVTQLRLCWAINSVLDVGKCLLGHTWNSNAFTSTSKQALVITRVRFRYPGVTFEQCCIYFNNGNKMFPKFSFVSHWKYFKLWPQTEIGTEPRILCAITTQIYCKT